MVEAVDIAQTTSRGKGRLAAIDLARGLALLAMAIYHFAWDLEFFGYIDPGTTQHGGWRVFARAIASSFLFLVGVSLVLAHARGIRWLPFAKRLGLVAGAAALISLATWFAMPQAFIFFGILHHIALASLVGLAFLRLPLAIVVLAIGCVAMAPHFLRAAVFDHPGLWWLGLAPQNPLSNDYVPLLPWFAAVLSGIVAARVGLAAGLPERLRRWRPGRWSRPLQFAGRHSLPVYLVHQPILIGAVWLFAQFSPAPAAEPATAFSGACTQQCEMTDERSGPFCALYCACVVGELEDRDMLDAMMTGSAAAQTDPRLQEIAGRCTFEAETADPGADLR